MSKKRKHSLIPRRNNQIPNGVARGSCRDLATYHWNGPKLTAFFDMIEQLKAAAQRKNEGSVNTPA